MFIISSIKSISIINTSIKYDFVYLMGYNMYHVIIIFAFLKYLIIITIYIVNLILQKLLKFIPYQSNFYFIIS